MLSYPIALLSSHLHGRMGADPVRFSERLGQHGSNDQTEVIWFHAASLGEVMQIGPLAKHLHRDHGAPILVTTTTQAGADWVARELPFVTHRFAPIDTPAAVRAFLASWSILAAIFVEGDLWPRLLRELQLCGIPQILLNARHSRTRIRFRTAFAALLAPFSLVTCRTENLATEMRALGLSADKVHVLPDLRLTMPQSPVEPALLLSLKDAIGPRQHWLAASTHPDDEDAVLTAHQAILQDFPEMLLIIAPRHPRRGMALNKMARDKGFTVAQRSQSEAVDPATQVYLADTLGELEVFYALSPIAFLGGSFGSEGGHNPYEPARHGTAILSGPCVANFRDAYAALINAGAAREVRQPATLGPTIAELMGTHLTQDMAQAGQAFMAETQNSLLAYADLVSDVLVRPKNLPSAKR